METNEEALSALLPIFLRIGLAGLLTDLIDAEVTAITEGTSACGSECSSLSPYLMIFFSVSISSLLKHCKNAY